MLVAQQQLQQLHQFVCHQPELLQRAPIRLLLQRQGWSAFADGTAGCWSLALLLLLLLLSQEVKQVGAGGC